MNLLRHVLTASIAVTGQSTVPSFLSALHLSVDTGEGRIGSLSGNATPNGPVEGRINVHIVPHTHDDVGWLKTVEEYYQGSASNVQIAAVKPILDTVVRALSENPDRRFIYVEMAYFTRWWQDQDDNKKEEVRNLVRQGRLQFANGGWASNDEATPTFVDIIDQHTLGTTSIVNLFGSEYVPRVGWQMDPFGHSRFQSTAYAKMGMDSWFFGRVDIEEFAFRKHSHTLETIHSNVLTGITEMYQAPSGFHWGYADRSQNPEITEDNQEQRINEFIQLCMQKKELYNFPDESTSHVMFTFGDDFEYSDADRWFRNMDKLIMYLNKRDERFNAFYSTPDLYTQSRFSQRSGRSPSSSHGWVTESGKSDWFPYCDGDARFDQSSGTIVVNQAHALWTGYFTSRPILKELVRTSSAVLELCRIAEVYALPPTADRSATTALWKALSVVQHHDGVSGTAKERVVVDYVKQLEEGIEGCKNFIRDSGLVQSHVADTKLHYYRSMLSSKDRGEITSWRHSKGSSSSWETMEVFFAYYRGSTGRDKTRPDQASGTYIFRPDCEEGSVSACESTRLDESAPPAFSATFKIKGGNRIEWSVGPLPDGPPGSPGYEVVLIVRDTSIRNGGKFFTDSNGYNWMERQVNKRSGYDYVVTDPVSANYYPVVGGIAISDDEKSLIVTPDRSVGGTSLRDGEIEIMVHRRLFADDAKGMAEPLDEKDGNGRGIVVHGVTYFEIHNEGKLNSAPKRDLIRPPVDLHEITGHDTNKFSWFFLKQSLPEKILVTHFHRLDVSEFCELDDIHSDCWLLRVMHADTSTSDASDEVEIVWTDFLNTVQIHDGKELTLNGGKLLKNVKKLEWTSDTSSRDVESTLTADWKSTIKSGDIRTYVFRVQPRQTAGGETPPVSHETA